MEEGKGGALLGEEVTLKMATFAPVKDKHMFGHELFLKEVKKSFDGRLKIDYLGGEEAIDPFEQPDAVRNGVVDIVFTGATYPEGVVPVAPAMEGSLLTPAEEREEGVFEMWQDVYREDMNSVYLGRFLVNRLQHLYTAYDISGIEDLKNKTFRSSPAQEPVLKKLGASAVIQPPGEIYTSLERGVIDGYGWPSVGMVDLGLAPLTSYRIDPGFYSGAGIMLMNADAFKRLPKPAQKELYAIGKRVETQVANKMRELVEEETRQIQTKFDVKILTLKGEEARRYQKLAYDALWQKVSQAAPAKAKKFRKATYDGKKLSPPLQ